MHLNGFDKIAWLYDPLAQLVFGDRLMKAQTAFLHHIKPGSRVLILGGGTGAIVSELLAQQPSCHITFIEASQAMLKRARRRLPASIVFIHGTEMSLSSEHPFDAVITPFYLDMFPEEQLSFVIQHIRTHLSKPAVWLVADFCNYGNLWQRLQLAVMYIFFRVTTGITASTLPDWDKMLTTTSSKKIESRRIDGFIEASVYRF